MSNSSNLSTETYPEFDNNLHSTSTNMEQNISFRVQNAESEGQRSNDDICQIAQKEDEVEIKIYHCFICSTEVDKDVRIPIHLLTARSHAPLIVLLTDILGYKFEDVELHSECVCKTCYKLVNLIDELQQTLTESKTDVRAKFLDTLQNLKLKYPRTDKILKQRCSHLSSNCMAKKKELLTSNENYYKDKQEISLVADTPCSNSENKEKENSIDFIDENNLNDTEIERVDIPIYDKDLAFYCNEEKLKIGIHRTNDNKFSCLYCKDIFDCDVALRLHSRGYHLPTFLYEKGSIQNISNKNPRIGIQLQNVTRKTGKCEHPYSCLHCDCTYKLQGTLLQHYKETHSTVKPFKCQYCRQSFRKAIQRTRHQVYHCQKRTKS